MREAWMIDELAHAGAEHLDPSFVASYDRKQGADPVDDVGALLDLGLDHDSVVVDLGAGTGRFACEVAPHCARVVAVDVSPVMLEHARARVDAASLANVDCVRSGLLTYEHDGAGVDFVCSRNALHHLPDFFKALALARIARMLRPRGVLRLRDLVFDFAPEEAETMLEQWFAAAADDEASGYTREELAEHVRCEFSTFSWLLEPMLEAAGFEILDRQFRRAVYGIYTCWKR
jgi:ubiquinone/menaquinone biosynthesis C-methylase UbiE